MEFRQLQHFLVVAQELSFTRAAEKAYVSQQALSKSVIALEKELGVTLFERLPRGLELTPCGQLLLKRSYHISTLINETITDIHNMDEEYSTNIRLAITAGVEDTFPVSILFRFQREHPHYRISTIIHNDRLIEERLIAEQLELGLMGARGDTVRLDFYPLIRSKTRVVMHRDNPLSIQESVRLDELRYEKFLFASSDFYSNNRLLAICNLMGFTPDIRHQAASVEYWVKLVTENQGIFLCPEEAVVKIRDPRIRMLRVKDDPCFFHVHLATKKNSVLSPGAQQLKKFILDSVMQDK